MDEEILARIVLTPAERRVMVEQAETARTALVEFIAHVEAGNVKGLVMTWADMAQTWEYMSQMLQAKTNRAIHSIVKEREQ